MSNSSTQHIEECGRRLEGLVQRTSCFLRAHLQRLEGLKATIDVPNVTSAANHQPSTADTARQQTEWERRKASDEARIEEQLEHLALAWRELETEQRRLEMQGPAVNEHSPEVGHSASETRTSAKTAASSSLDLIDAPSSRGASSAAMQFQKLKREVRQQSRRKQ